MDNCNFFRTFAVLKRQPQCAGGGSQKAEFFDVFRYVSEALEPGLEFEDHVVVEGKRLAVAPAMTARGVDVDGGGHIVLVELLVVVEAVGSGHSLIIVAEGEEGARGGAVYLQVVAELGLEALQLLLVFLIVGELTKEAVVRAHVGIAGIHGDDGVEEDLEVGRSIARRMGGDGGGEVTASREAHDAHIVGVDVPLGGMAAHELHGLLGIGDGDEAVTVGHAVLEDDEGDALVIEERGPLMTLVVHGEVGIAATRAAHHSAPCSLLLGGQINGEFRFVSIVEAGYSRPIGP